MLTEHYGDHFQYVHILPQSLFFPHEIKVAQLVESCMVCLQEKLGLSPELGKFLEGNEPSVIATWEKIL